MVHRLLFDMFEICQLLLVSLVRWSLGLAQAIVCLVDRWALVKLRSGWASLKFESDCIAGATYFGTCCKAARLLRQGSYGDLCHGNVCLPVAVGLPGGMGKAACNPWVRGHFASRTSVERIVLGSMTYSKDVVQS